MREADKRFRRVHETHAPSEPLPLGQWYRYQRMSPVTPGEPVRFFWILGESGAVSRIGLWVTGPVVAVLPDEAPSYLLPARG